MADLTLSKRKKSIILTVFGLVLIACGVALIVAGAPGNYGNYNMLWAGIAVFAAGWVLWDRGHSRARAAK